MNRGYKPQHLPPQPSDFHLLFPCSRNTESLLATFQSLVHQLKRFAIRVFAAIRQRAFAERHELPCELHAMLARTKEEALASVQQRHRQVRVPNLPCASVTDAISSLDTRSVARSKHFAARSNFRRLCHIRPNEADLIAGEGTPATSPAMERRSAAMCRSSAWLSAMAEEDERMTVVLEMSTQAFQRRELTQLSQALPQIRGSGFRRGLVGGAGFELLDDCFDLGKATVVSLRVSVKWPELRRRYLRNSHLFGGKF
ncbi:hypothetical protein CR513_00983, partial [Mucuna pruriens]